MASLDRHLDSEARVSATEKDGDSKHSTASALEVDIPEVCFQDQATQQQSWLGYLWDTADLGPKERRLLLKVDASLLVFASLGYFIKNLDQSNIQNAFFAGMEEDLKMYGNQLVHATSFWTAGYVVGQVPINILLTRAPPQIVIPTLELLWGFVTLATYSVRDVRSLYALRFFVGLFESGFYPGMQYILASWYTPRELGKRTTLFWASGSLGTMFSGFLQTAAYERLNGVNGIAGWRWLLIIDAIVTLPIAVLGFAFLPNGPNHPWSKRPSFWLNAEEVALAQARMQAIGRKGREPWTRAKFRRIFTDWRIYVLPFQYIIGYNAGVQSPMQYWMKSFNATPPPVPGVSWTVAQIQLYPLPTTAIFAVAAIIAAWLSDGPAKGRRWPFLLFGGVFGLIMDIVWLKMPLYTNIGGHLAYFWLIMLGAASGALSLNWVSEICSDDNELRAITVALSNDLAYVVTAVAPNFVWKTTSFPRALEGYHWSIGMQILSLLWTFLILRLLWRDQQKLRAG